MDLKEKRLIDANARIEEIKLAHCVSCDNYGGVRCRACWVDDAMSLIEDAPTVDAVEVIHAHWDNNGICTLCGYPIPTDSKYDFIDKDDCLFCYHCGAKMDGGNEDV